MSFKWSQLRGARRSRINVAIFDDHAAQDRLEVVSPLDLSTFACSQVRGNLQSLDRAAVAAWGGLLRDPRDNSDARATQDPQLLGPTTADCGT